MNVLRYGGLWWTLGFALALLILLGSLMPPGEGDPAFPDKLLHFLAYALLGGWFAALSSHRVAVFLLVLAWGGMIELLQGLTPLRQPEWLDLAANAAGAACGVFIARLLPDSPFALIESLIPEPRHGQ
ncbi:MAG TPA: VanZ family protein [Gammaproteobacteria bacterium]|nr:VanZ family protein [Gammaproteobacteria bacterium]